MSEHCHEKWCSKMVSSESKNHEESAIGRAKRSQPQSTQEQRKDYEKTATNGLQGHVLMDGNNEFLNSRWR